MFNHILFGLSVYLAIYCLNEWLWWLFIVWLNHFSESIAIKIIESLKHCLYHNMLLSPIIYSGWFFANMLVWLSHDQLLPIADLLLFVFSSASEIWSQVYIGDKFHFVHFFPSGPKNISLKFCYSTKSLINIWIRTQRSSKRIWHFDMSFRWSSR